MFWAGFELFFGVIAAVVALIAIVFVFMLAWGIAATCFALLKECGKWMLKKCNDSVTFRFAAVIVLLVVWLGLDILYR